MQESTKNWLGIAGIIVLIAIAWAALSAASSYSASIQPSSFRSFSVTGEGKVNAIPDVAAISFGVTVEGGKDVGALQAENTKKMNAIIALLKQQGLASKDIQTSNYSIDARTQYYDCNSSPRLLGAGVKVCPPTEVVGYTISQNVAVKIRDFSKVGAVLQGVAEKGATGISGLSFTIDDPTKVESEARAEAIAKAKVKAEAVARAGGFSLGRLLSIDEGSTFQPPYYIEAAPMMKSASAGATAPTIEAGSKDIKVSVTLRYEIR